MTADLDLAAALAAWDGRDVGPWSRLVEALPAAPAVHAELVDLAGRDDPVLAVGASWVLKACCERGDDLGRRLAGRLVARLDGGEPWERQLHLLQLLPHVELTDARWEALAGRLPALCAHERPFVRAWAYNAWGLVASRRPERRAAVEALFVEAESREPASVRARIRHARAAWARSSRRRG